MAKKTAQESLGRLRTGLTRETPASRAAEESKTSGVGDVENNLETSTQERTTERKVRVSVDLPRTEHKYLRDFAYDSEADAMSVMRALLVELMQSEDLAVRIRERLATSR